MSIEEVTENLRHIFRDMEQIVSPNNVDRPGLALSVLCGLCCVGIFGWLDNTNRQPNYRELRNPQHPRYRPFDWISWDLFMGLRTIRDTFAHSLEGIIEDENLDELREFHHQIELGQIRILYIHGEGEERIERNDIVQPFFTIQEISNTNQFRLSPENVIIHLTARAVVHYFENARITED